MTLSHDRQLTVTSAYWHPFADMATVPGHELVIARGEGVYLWDDGGQALPRRHGQPLARPHRARARGDGRGDRDGNCGRSRPSRRSATSPTRPRSSSSSASSQLSPMADPRVFLCLGGGDAIDTAAKLARQYWAAQGQPERMHLISRTFAYHGTHGFGTSLVGMESMRQGYGPLLGSVSHVDHQSPEALEAEIERVGAGERRRVLLRARDRRRRRAARARGLHRGRRRDLQAPRRAARDRQRDLRVRARRHLVRLRALGHRARHGRAREGHHERLPAARRRDGRRRRRRAVLGRPGGPMFRHGATYAGHPTCCAAALANIEILEREGLVARGRELEGELMDALAPLAEHAACGEIRGGLGLAAAVDLTPEALESVPGAIGRYAAAIREAGVLLRPQATGVAIGPPLTSSARTWTRSRPPCAPGSTPSPPRLGRRTARLSSGLAPLSAGARHGRRAADDAPPQAARADRARQPQGRHARVGALQPRHARAARAARHGDDGRQARERARPRPSTASSAARSAAISRSARRSPRVASTS